MKNEEFDANSYLEDSDRVQKILLAFSQLEKEKEEELFQEKIFVTVCIAAGIACMLLVIFAL